MADDPRARNNARFARFMQAREQAQADPRGPSPMRGAYAAWKLREDARRTIPPILLPEASGSPSDAFQQAQRAVDEVISASCLNPTLVAEEGQPVNTSRALATLQRHAEASEGHLDAKGARHAHAQARVDAQPSRATNTQRLRCGENGHQCGWCHFCRKRAGTPCPQRCWYCDQDAEAAADAARHPDEAAAILTHPADAKPKKKIERVRGFQI